MPVLHTKGKAMNPTRTIVSSFALVIAVGTLLLMLPISSKAGQWTFVVDALFTATSATCVTGLVIADTYQNWTLFGQVVIMLLIQIGGLGLVTFVTFFNLVIGKKLGLRNMQMASESISSDTFSDSAKLIRSIVRMSLIIEAIGALVLMITFVPKYGVYGIFMSLFTAVSAFCNAGFDLMGMEGAYVSLCNYNGNPLVMVTIMALIVCGGLGFVVWHDLAAYRRTKRLTLHTKIVLITTAILIVSGALIFLLFESGNKSTLGGLNAGERGIAAFFQSITLRTAGFNSVDVNSLQGITKVFSIIFMFIGAAPGSTAGGIKVTTFAVILMTVISVIRNKEETEIMGRRVNKNTVYKSLAIMSLSIVIVVIASLSVYLIDGIPTEKITGLNALFEATSAFGTVGLSAGATGQSGWISHLVLILTMFIGRVGPVSLGLSLAVNADARKKNQVIPEGKVIVG